jgi:rare lipoprotein A
MITPMLIGHPFLCIAAAVVLLLAGCASPPAGKPSDERDGVSAQVPPNLAQLPDAEPRIEAVRSGGPNRPYEALGKRYTPMTGDAPFRERGLASWYGRKFHGRATASGETYDMHAMTAAHPTLPIPSYARVRNPANGKEVIVRVNDRGPFHDGRIVDLSYAAALKLELLRGVAPVELERITFDDIRSGAWRRDGSALAQRAPASSMPSVEVTAPVVPVAAVGAESSASAPDPQRSPPIAQAAPGFWVQLGAFRQRDGALAFRERVLRELEGLTLAVFEDRSMHRLQAGPYRTRYEATGAAERIRTALQLVPVIVERK